MKMMNPLFRIIIPLILFCSFNTNASAQYSTELKIDSKLLVSLKECRKIFDEIGSELYPGWDFKKMPVLFYKPKVQEVLINFPYKPKGFSVYHGFNPLGDETIYYRNDTTFFDIDDQNTSFNIDSIEVLVVADPASSMRNQIRYTVSSMPVDTALKWVDEWGFMQSSYDQLLMIFHEGFHVYQNRKAPEKYANEVAVIKYPALDAINNSLYVLEGKILREAMLAKNLSERKELAKQFTAVRTSRIAVLDSAFIEYENLNEYVEGTAKYIEYKVLSKGEQLTPSEEMYYHYGFNGYKSELPKIFKKRADNMMKIIALSDNRFGNKYGTGPVRFRLYESGAAIAFILDDVNPEWKKTIFNDKVFLFEILKNSLKLSPEEEKNYLEKAKLKFGYEDAFKEKLIFEEDGKKFRKAKLDEILNTEKTLVTISYEGFVERAGVIRYTPFGITAVDDKTNIFDMVPVVVLFKEGVTLDMLKAIPVCVDKLNKRVVFAVSSLPGGIVRNSDGTIECSEFILKGAKTKLSLEGNKVNIGFE
jgi:CRISPR/Cas system CMR subunit Cmr4 (Cas7 group RAMP superfamily)